MSRIKNKKVFVGLSGGVDSSVAAHLLKEQGYDVVGVFLRCYNIDGCAERDAEDARRVAEHLHIPFYVFDFEQEYKDLVVSYMIEGYRAGGTPNPDVMCNREIKFGLFMKRALQLGADYVATGHYVRRRDCIEENRPMLAIAEDKNKDQSYFLWTLTSEQIEKSLFPLGDLVKPEVRKIAKKIGLPTAEKKDSQGVCFLGMIHMQDFLSMYIPKKRGEARTVEGELVGFHEGVWFYTIGQRHIDLDPIPGKKKQNDQRPFYVAKKDVQENVLYVAEGSEHEALTRKEVELIGVNMILNLPFRDEDAYTMKIPVYARVRYRQPLFSASLVLSCVQSSVTKCMLEFDYPQKFVAEGQSAVFYSKHTHSKHQNEMCLVGGGIIV